MSRAHLYSLLVFVLLMGPGIAGAGDDEAPAYPVRLVGVLDAYDDVDEAILVGPSGELYHPRGEHRWRRRVAGGVAADVVGAVRGPADTIFAVGRRAPLFRFDPARGAWFAAPLPNRGTAALGGAGGADCVSIGRHVYLPTAERWRRADSTRAAIAALWAASADRFYVATHRGKLARIGRGARKLRHPLGDDDRIRAFAGTPGRDLYALAGSGTLLAVGRAAAREVTPAEELAPVEIHTLAPRAAGGVWVTGLAGADREPTLMIAEGRELRRAGALPALDGDRYAALAVDDEGTMLLVTRRGQAHVRDPGGEWEQGRVLGTLPEGTHRPSDVGAPAHTR